jgi:hypothetical protein
MVAPQLRTTPRRLLRRPQCQSPPRLASTVDTGNLPMSPPQVRFTRTSKVPPQGTWAYTAQLTSITENPNGFPGSPGAPPQDTYLMVRVAITSQTTGREVPPPKLDRRVACHGFRPAAGALRGGEPENEGYDEGPEAAPDSQGMRTVLGSGKAQLWDQEYLVSVAPTTARVKCVFGPELSRSTEATVRAVGANKLN